MKKDTFGALVACWALSARNEFGGWAQPVFYNDPFYKNIPRKPKKKKGYKNAK